MTHPGWQQIDLFDLDVTKASKFVHLGHVDSLQDEKNAGDDEEVPEDGAVQDKEHPEGHVQHVCPVKHL